MKIIDKLQNMGLPELLALADFAEEISEKKYLDLSFILDILKVREAIANQVPRSSNFSRRAFGMVAGQRPAAALIHALGSAISMGWCTSSSRPASCPRSRRSSSRPLPARAPLLGRHSNPGRHCL
jgi:hypothetical protein